MQADTAAQPAEAAEQAAAESLRGKRHPMPRQGNVHATILENHSENGTFYTADFQRRYVDKNDQPQLTHSFKSTDMDDLMKQTAAVQESSRSLRRAAVVSPPPSRPRLTLAGRQRFTGCPSTVAPV